MGGRGQSNVRSRRTSTAHGTRHCNRLDLETVEHAQRQTAMFNPYRVVDVCARFPGASLARPRSPPGYSMSALRAQIQITALRIFHIPHPTSHIPHPTSHIPYLSLPGTPTTVRSSTTDRITTDPAPITHRSPIERSGSTRAPIPTNVCVPTRTRPASTAPGAMCVLKPTTHSCSTIAPVFTIAWSITSARAFTTARGPINTPAPIRAELDTTAVG